MTKKSNEIYLKCEVCEDAHIYQLNDQEIIALDAGWYSIEENQNLIAEKPMLNREYELSLKGPLKIDLNNNFWSIYMNPNAYLKGFETENDILSVGFCLCKPVRVIDTNDRTALVRIKLVNKVDLNHSLDLKPYPSRLLEELNSLSQSSRYCKVENFRDYTLIIANMESDIGLTVIVKKENGISKIVAINEWDFHKNIWYSSTSELSKEQEEKHNIQYW